MKKKLFLLPLTILLSFSVTSCNSYSDICAGCDGLGILSSTTYQFDNFLDFNNFYENFKEYNEYRVFAPNNLDTFEYTYEFTGLAEWEDVKDDGNFKYLYNLGLFTYVSSELFSLEGKLIDVSELELTNDKEFIYELEPTETSNLFAFSVFYDNNVIFSGGITYLSEEENDIKEINENINLIVEEFYNGTFSDTSTN